LLDQLFAGTRTLSQVVDTLRNPGKTMPDITQDVEGLDRWISTQQDKEKRTERKPPATRKKKTRLKQPAAEQEKPEEIQPSPEAEEPEAVSLLPGLAAYPDMLNSLERVERRKIRQAVEAGSSFALVVFIPSGVRAARGENVDLVRRQLNDLGTIIKAVPVMLGGEFRFLFLVTGDHTWDFGPALANEVIPLAAQVLPDPALVSEPVPTQSQAFSNNTNIRRLTGPVVRVELARLDELMHSAGNIITLRSRLEESISKLNGVPRPVKRELVEIDRQLARALRNLRRSILRTRMVPLREAFGQMPLVARDLARMYEKEVRLVLQGEEIEVDKLLVERLLDPLIHLVRNAITHGIEPPAERTAAGKPTAGTLTLRGIPQGDRFRIEIQDDGRGIDKNKISRHVQELGWLPKDQTLADSQVLEFLLRPGFSTHPQADMAAGRGVGLDIVARMVRSFGGQIKLETEVGRGTTFFLELPLTLVILDVILLRVGSEVYGIPQDAVERIIEIDPGRIVRAESGELYQAGEGYYVLHRVTRLFGLPEDGKPRRCLHGLLTILEGEETSGRSVLVVDQVTGMREVVIYPLSDPLVARPGLSGATELGSGQVVLILDAAGLLRMARKKGM
jgi:two-component system chemotaxis sensor kinase CheA